jgi:hypothetical protein
VLERPGLIAAACECYAQDRVLYGKMLHRKGCQNEISFNSSLLREMRGIDFVALLSARASSPPTNTPSYGYTWWKTRPN